MRRVGRPSLPDMKECGDVDAHESRSVAGSLHRRRAGVGCERSGCLTGYSAVHRSLASDRTHGDRAFAGTASRPVRIGVARIRARRGAPLVLGPDSRGAPRHGGFRPPTRGDRLSGRLPAWLCAVHRQGRGRRSLVGAGAARGSPLRSARLRVRQAAARRPAVRGDGTSVACAASARTDHARAGRHRRSGTEVGGHPTHRTVLRPRRDGPGRRVRRGGRTRSPWGGRRLAQHQRPLRRFTRRESQLVVAVRGAAAQVTERLRALEQPAGWRAPAVACVPSG
ncbi:hypothetical protein MBT84_12765 [Streptomyces sp. MBT84]|nr:hypothetical protein [Streptomyces sp. MBT84]